MIDQQGVQKERYINEITKLLKTKQAYQSHIGSEKACSSLTSQTVLKSQSLSVYNAALKQFNKNKVRCGGHATNPGFDQENQDPA